MTFELTKTRLTLVAATAAALMLSGCAADSEAAAIDDADTQTTIAEEADESTEVESSAADEESDASDTYEESDSDDAHEPGGDLELVLDDIPMSELTQEEIDGLVWMREEEKLARDVYLTLYDMWELRPFTNIAQSEQTHMDSVLALFDRYDLEDPVVDDTIGVFTDPTLQQLYDDLVAQGSVSVEDALAVGATIEELDIVDLQDRATDTEDIKLVYASLEQGSRNHLRAFMRNLDRYEVDYTPQYLSVAAFDEIVSSDMEQGSGH